MLWLGSAQLTFGTRYLILFSKRQLTILSEQSVAFELHLLVSAHLTCNVDQGDIKKKTFANGKPKKEIPSESSQVTRAVPCSGKEVLLLPTCVRRGWGRRLYDCGAIICHAELASSLGVQRGEGGRARPSVPPIGPPRELQVQGLIQGEHGHKLLTSHLYKQSQRGRVKPSGANEGQLGFLITTHTMKCCIPV